MKSIFKILVISIITLNFTNAQLLSSETVVDGDASNSLSFFDGSSSPAYNGFNSAGKGLLFPRIDLTTLSTTDIFDAGSIGQSNYNPNYYDGLVVYNTTAGTQTTTNPMGSVADDNFVEGFYYYQNASGTLGGGTWLPFVGGSDTKTEISTTEINNTKNIINGTPEKVVILPGTATGNTTEMTLDASGVTNGPLSVTKLREAKIYDGSKLIMIASGDYDTATNTLVTGDGMVNKLLPDIGANAYTVELYFE